MSICRSAYDLHDRQLNWSFTSGHRCRRPVVVATIPCQRRHHNAVAELDLTDHERLEESCRHGACSVVRLVCSTSDRSERGEWTELGSRKQRQTEPDGTRLTLHFQDYRTSKRIEAAGRAGPRPFTNTVRIAPQVSMHPFWLIRKPLYLGCLR
jgi:hypothetical protein